MTIQQNSTFPDILAAEFGHINYVLLITIGEQKSYILIPGCALKKNRHALFLFFPPCPLS